MIYDSIGLIAEKYSKAHSAAVDSFLKIVSPEMPEGYYRLTSGFAALSDEGILGESIYARVMSYKTAELFELSAESHISYIDVQSSIVGGEGISVFYNRDMPILNEYNPVKDVVTYNANNSAHSVFVRNLPGYFTMIFPWEIHRPKEKIDSEAFVKKFVIKLKVSEYERGAVFNDR